MCILLALAIAGATSALIYNYKNSQIIKAVSTLYNQTLNNYRYSTPDTTKVDTLKLHMRAVTTTVSAIASMVSKACLEKAFGPKRRIGSLIVISYYYSGEWHQALIKSPLFSVTSIVKITAEQNNDLSVTLTDVTNEILPLLGPSEDCFGYKLTPASFGYDALLVELLNENRLSEIRIEKTQDIGESIADSKRIQS